MGGRKSRRGGLLIANCVEVVFGVGSCPRMDLASTGRAVRRGIGTPKHLPGIGNCRKHTMHDPRVSPDRRARLLTVALLVTVALVAVRCESPTTPSPAPTATGGGVCDAGVKTYQSPDGLVDLTLVVQGLGSAAAEPAWFPFVARLFAQEKCGVTGGYTVAGGSGRGIGQVAARVSTVVSLEGRASTHYD